MPSKPLNIGFVLDDSLDKPDGVQQYVLALGEWLKKRGHNVHYLVGQTRRSDLSNIHSLSRNLRVRFNKNRMGIPMFSSNKVLKRVLKQNEFDILHVQVPYSPLLAHKLVKFADEATAVVGTFHIAPHNLLARVGTKSLGFWTKGSLKRFDKIFSVSTAAQELARKGFKIKTEVLPNTFDYEWFHSAQPLKKYKDGHLTVLFLGRLVPRKGAMVLLKAIKILKRRNLQGFKVIVCGSGPHSADLKNYTTKNGLDGLVEFAGFINENDKPAYYATADIAVFPSTGGESFGIVLIEAMASGAAVLAGANSGYKTVMNDKPELLVPVNNPTELADKIQWLIEDDRARKQMSAWGQEYSRRFDINEVGSKLEGEYRQLLRKRPKR